MPLLLVQMELDKSLTSLRELLRKRREKICELLLEQEELCEKLGEPHRLLLADPLPTEAELAEFRAHLNALAYLRAERLNKCSILRREIKEFLQMLDLNALTDKERSLLQDYQIKLDIETLERLSYMHSTYEAKVKELRSRIDGMLNQLENLWQRLDTSPNIRQKIRRIDSYTKNSHDVIYSELQRCEVLKRQNIKRFVEQLRQELEEWWDKTLKSDVERSRFTHFNSNCFQDDLLVLHEMELEDLKRHYETNEQIYELYAERQKRWERMIALEEKATDPSRYNNRGGQLFREEKERKTITNKLPKIEQQITDLVRMYEDRENAPFLIYGENILENMAADWEKKRQKKEQQTSARKQRTVIGKSGITRAHMPLSVKNCSAQMAISVSALLGGRPPLQQTTMRSATSQKRKLNPREEQWWWQ